MIDAAPLDLNKPEDAKAYIESWIEPGDISTHRSRVTRNDEDYILVARQLFLYCDPRPIAGSLQ